MVFEIISKNGVARAGELRLPSGKVLETPFYMPVMTKGAAKNLSPEMLFDAGTQCSIANSFILTLKPGVDFLEGFGGLHKFSNWKGGFFTDSGGFQMLSKSLFVGIDNNYVTFKNPFTGRKMHLTPEECMSNQLKIGSDVAMALDHVPSFYGMTREKMSECINRTHYWAKRCKIAHDSLQSGGIRQLLFGIAQGGIYNDLRAESSKFISSVGFDGIAFGGFCFGESDSEMYEGIKASKSGAPESLPVYIMGMGHPVQIIESIGLGCDIFDSTFPTMSGRNGTLFTRKGNLRILSKEYSFSEGPIEEGCSCYACKNYSIAFIRQLLKMKENFGKTLATIHNVHFMHKLINDSKVAIKEGRFIEFKEQFVSDFGKIDENVFKYS